MAGPVEFGAHGFFAQVRTHLGDRVAETRFDPDDALRVTVIDLTSHDTAAIDSIAERFDVGRVRIERADPADLRAWERLRHDLVRLHDSQPRVLQQWPTPNRNYRRPPVHITLTANAESTAADLHHRYGEFVALHVGAFPYPMPADPPTVARRQRPAADEDTALSTDLRITLDGPLTIRRGQTGHHGLLLTNLTNHTVSVATNGALTATILDDAGAEVGGYTGAHNLSLVPFGAAPQQTVRIPLLVGTASHLPALGYALPPGTWHLIAPLDDRDGRRRITPALPFTITE